MEERRSNRTKIIYYKTNSLAIDYITSVICFKIKSFFSKS
jgi:hypothetical protein